MRSIAHGRASMLIGRRKMTTNKRVRLSTAIKRVLDMLDSAVPSNAAVMLTRSYAAIVDHCGYEAEEAYRLVNWLAGQEKHANWQDLAEEWCDEHRFPKLECRACGGVQVCYSCRQPVLDGGVTDSDCLGKETFCLKCAKEKGITPPKPTTLSLEEQRRLLHETGMFDERGNFLP